MSNQNNHPNVLVFFTDQQRWDTTGVHGNPLGLTPNFDRFCRTGTHLFNAFTCQPVCGPARACLQTGLYATQNGSFRNSIPLDPSLPTLAQLFREHGYTTGYIGKWHLADKGPGAVPAGSRGGYEYWLAANSVESVSDAYEARLFDNNDEEVLLPGYRVDAYADATIRYLSEKRDKPFFLFTSYLEPHHQNHRDDYPAPDGYAEQYNARWTPPDLQELGGTSARHLAGYWGMVKRLDEAFGRVMDTLKTLGLAENTIVLFTSDHGCHFKTRNAEYKRSCHDSSLRVPTLLMGPGLQEGRTFHPLASLIDLPPTLLEAAGIPVPESMSGKSLIPEIRGQSSRSEEEDYIFAQISESEHGRTIRTRRWKYAISAPYDRSPTTSQYQEAYLYDLLADPYELENLIGVEPFSEITTVLREKLLAKMQEIGEPPVTLIPAEPRKVGQRRPFIRPESWAKTA